MKLTTELSAIANDIDHDLRSERFRQVFMDGDNYARWYSTLLSTLTIVIGTSDVVYAQSDHDEANGTARFTLFTAAKVVVASVKHVGEDDEATPEVSTKIVPRTALVSLDVAVSLPIDVRGSAEYDWPGDVEVRAVFAGLPDTVTLRGPGAVSRDPQKPSPILNLLAALQGDWTSRSAQHEAQ